MWNFQVAAACRMACAAVSARAVGGLHLLACLLSKSGMAVRKRHNLTQVELAQRLGVSQRYLSELETGRPKVLNAKLLQLLAELGIELSFREVAQP